MDLHFTPEQEAYLIEIAAREQTTPEQVIFDVTRNLYETRSVYEADAEVRQIIRERIKQADRGEFLEEEEMDARFHKMMHG